MSFASEMADFLTRGGLDAQPETEDSVSCSLDTGDTGKQNVEVIGVGNLDRKQIISISAPVVPAAWKVNGELEREFLRKNSQRMFGHFAIMKAGDDDVLFLKETLILDGLEEKSLGKLIAALAGDAASIRAGLLAAAKS